jgi:microcystin degradation protein MlrC
MRIFVAGLRTETNSFVERPTGLEDFEAYGYFDGTCPIGALDEGVHPGYATLARRAREDGHVLITGPAAYATPGGPVRPDDYARLKSRILARLAEHGPPDIVLLDLHGAMMTGTLDDAEGDLLAAIRQAAGEEAVIAALIDPHATLSPRMLRFADLIHAYKEYPHTDVAARAAELYALAIRIRRGEISPRHAVVPCHMLGGFPTTREPMRSFVDALSRTEREQPDIVSVSLIHGFPWSDSRDNGARVLVYADRDRQLAERIAQRFALSFRAIAPEAAETPCTPEQGLELVHRYKPGRVIVADTSDNPGGGADGDATHVLRHLTGAGIRRIGAAVFHDPVSVARCIEAGMGTELSLWIGGRASHFSGQPLPIRARVAHIAEHIDQDTEARYAPQAPLVRLACDFGDLILSDRRQEALSPRIFTETGATIADYDVLLLKSSNHFRAGFAAHATQIVSIGSPTAMDPELARLDFRKLPRPIWPLDPMPAAPDRSSADSAAGAL